MHGMAQNLYHRLQWRHNICPMEKVKKPNRQLNHGKSSNHYSVRPFCGLKNDQENRLLINVLLKVRDNGIGISREEQQVIFDKFGRAAIHERNRKGGVSGFGLGLNYVDQVMQAHGGKVTVSSEKDRFSEFTLYIPKKSEK